MILEIISGEIAVTTTSFTYEKFKSANLYIKILHVYRACTGLSSEREIRSDRLVRMTLPERQEALELGRQVFDQEYVNKFLTNHDQKV